MDSTKFTGKAQTVLGPIDADSIGITTMHEHLLFDLTVWFKELDSPAGKALAHQPITMDNRYQATHRHFAVLDNLVHKDEQVAINEATLYKEVGGNTIVDATNIGLGRNPLALRHIAQATGLNIIMGSGYYVWKSHPADFDTKTEDEIADGIVRDLTLGVDDTGVRAGIIGEMGNSWPWHESEQKAMGAAASAQRRTGAPMTVHPGQNELAPIQIVEFLKERRTDLSRVIFCHPERTFYGTYDGMRRVLDAGCSYEFDLFGWEGYHPTAYPLDVPNDWGKIKWIIELIAEGYVNQIMLAQDICMKVYTTTYGGHGMGHILRNIVPRMKLLGISEEHIHTMLVDNPKRFLQFAEID